MAQVALHAQSPTPQSVVVKLRSGVQPSAFITTLHAASIQTAQPFIQPHVQKQASVLQSKNLAELERYIVLQTDPNGGSLATIMEQLRQRGDVESVELNTRHSLPPNRTASVEQPKQTEETNEQWALEKIQAEKAWQKATGKGVIIGVIDTGLEFTHPEFAGQLWINTAEDLNGNGRFDPWTSTEVIDGVTGDLNGKDDDGNGYNDDVIGYDFVDQAILNIGDARTRDAIPADEHGHGTNVSGVIAARKDGIGITGVAYDSKIMVLRAFDATGNGEDDDFAAAVVYAALNGARVINMSFGDVYFPPILHDAIAFAHDLGCVIVASSGNAGGSSAHYPSNFSEVIAVGSTSRNDKLAATSTFGSLVDMVAPGIEIRTTDMRTSYTTASGTSFSAPHVAAAAALLLEQRPTLTPEEVRGLLTASADDIDTRGWDLAFSSGRLNATAALDMLADATILIAFPTLDYTVALSTTNSIAITGSVFAPFFRSYTVDITDDERQGTWQTIASSNKQIHDGTLGVLSTQSLHDGTYFLRIRVEQTNGNTLERRQRFYSSSAPLAFTHVTPYVAWHNDKRTVVVSARTNQQTRFSVRFRPKGSQQPFHEQSEVEHFTKNHTVVIGSEALADIPYEAEAIAVTPNGITITQPFEFQRPSTAFAWGDIFPLPYELPDGFLLNQTADLYGDGTAAVVVASQEATRNVTRTFTFNGKKFIASDSLEALWIPRGMGDSNGDGIQEVFTQVGPRSTLFQRSTPSSSPFAQRIFSDNTDTSNFWASGMSDINKDGHPELIAHSHEAYSAHTFANGAYHPIAATSIPFPPDFASSIASADFDGDGRVELCYGTTNSGFVIVEYRNGQFLLDYQNANDNFNGNYFITQLDIDNDGVQEILICTYRDLATNNDREYDTPLWSFKLLRATAANTYEVLWQDYSYGVRPPNPYRSGVAAGNIDGRPGDELIILAFPNTFVFTWNPETRSVVPLWYFQGSVSNTAIVHDFNGNGINEFGFNTGRSTRFFEYDPNASKRPAPPTGLVGYAVDATSASLQWNPSAHAEGYEVYGGIANATTQLLRLGTTTETTLVIGNLEEAQEYLFIVLAVNPTYPEQQSDRSNDALVFMHTPAQPISATLVNRRTIEVQFSHDIPESALQPSIFTVEGVGLPSTVVPSGAKKAVLLFAYPLPTGEHTLSVASFRDRYNSPTPTATFSLDIQPQGDNVELYLTNIRVLSPTMLDVSFSEPVAPATAVLPSAYALAPFGRIAEAQTLQENPETVRLMLGSELPLRSIGQNYVLTVRDVQGTSGHRMTKGVGKALGFTLQAENIADAYAYPNPLRLSEGTSVYFGNLADGATVTVRTMEGQLIATLTENDGNGGVQWDCRTSSGSLIKSGVYVFSVQRTDAQGITTESDFKKLAVIR